MSSIQINGNTSGSITIEAPAVAGTNTLTLPASTGTLATTADITGPAFSAYSSTTQAMTTATWTKIVFGTELFDTNSNYDTATARFTPTVAGYYQLNATIYTTGTITRCFTQLYLNGDAIKHLFDITSAINRSGGSALMYMNGSTDYLEVYAFVQGTGLQVEANQQGTRFEAALIRGA